MIYHPGLRPPLLFQERSQLIPLLEQEGWPKAGVVDQENVPRNLSPYLAVLFERFNALQEFGQAPEEHGAS